MKRRRAGAERRRAPSLAAMMLEAARRAPPASEHMGDDDCALCRMTAGLTPVEVITLPDGSVLEVHELPPPGPNPGAS